MGSPRGRTYERGANHRPAQARGSQRRHAGDDGDRKEAVGCGPMKPDEEQVEIGRRGQDGCRQRQSPDQSSDQSSDLDVGSGGRCAWILCVLWNRASGLYWILLLSK